MGIKLMIFIDGSWLFHNVSYLRETFKDPEYTIDYKKFPHIIASFLEKHTHEHIDIVRTNFFGAMPINKPGFDPIPQSNFFAFLEKECHFWVEVYDIDFRHSTEYRPHEKCVDIALATTMMKYALIPGAFDVAALVAGDLDYMPLLSEVRLAGKRTLLVAMKANEDYAPTSERLIKSHNLFDFPVMFLDDYLEELRLTKEKKLRVCESCGEKKLTHWDGPNFYCPTCISEKNHKVIRRCHSCGEEKETTWKGEVFYCDDCREKYRRRKWY